VKVLCQKHKFHRLNIDVVDSAGRTPLHFAVMDGRMEVVRLLLEWEGINIDVEDSAGLTPLHYSVQNGHSEVVELLLNKGKSFATLDYDRQCAVFETLLHLAIELGVLTIAIHLLNALGSRMNDFHNDISTKFSNNESLNNQSRLLASAAMSNHFEIIKYIVKWQPEVNVNERSEWATIPGLVATPLHFAAIGSVASVGGPKHGHVEAVQELLEHRELDVNAEDNKKMTPLRYAIEAGDVDMVKVLCQKDKFHRLNIDVVDSAGRTPLHFAVVDGRMEVVKVLLERQGISIDAEDSEGLTPLQYSVQNGHSEVVELLLNKGRSFATLDYDRQCAAFEKLLHLATKLDV